MKLQFLDKFTSSFLNYLRSQKRNPEMIERFTLPILLDEIHEGYEIKMVNGESRINYFVNNEKKVLSQTGAKIAPIIFKNDSPELDLMKKIVIVTEGESDAIAVLPFASKVMAILGSNLSSSITSFKDCLKSQLADQDYRFYVIFDNDQAGLNGSSHAVKNLYQVFPKSEVYLINWSKLNGSKDLRELINSNKHSLDEILNHCKKIESNTEEINKILSTTKKEEKEHCFKKLNLEKFDFFIDCDGVSYLSRANSSLSFPLSSEDSKRLLSKEAYDQLGKIFNRNKIDELVRFIEMEKMTDNVFDVSIRTSFKDGIFYYDLGRADSKILTISKNGIEEVVDQSIKFKRPKSSIESKYIKSNAIDILKVFSPHLNINSPYDLILALAFIIKSLLGKSGASPILVIEGEQGSSKTTTTKFLKRIIDPSSSDVKRLPAKLDDLHNYAINNYLLCFDNLSGLNHQLSDELCVISTGGAISKRELYSNDTEFTRNIQRPVILNGIEDIGERPDFLDRTISIHLPSISPTNRKSEIELWNQFENTLPIIMGSLFDLAHKVIKLREEIEFKNLSRMTEFSKIGICIEKILDYGDHFFQKALAKNKAGQLNQIISTNPLLITIASLMSEQSEYQGSPHQLFCLLKDKALAKKLTWGFPQNPASLTKELKRHRSTMKQMGIEFCNDKNSQGRFIKLSKHENIVSQLTFVTENLQRGADYAN